MSELEIKNLDMLVLALMSVNQDQLLALPRNQDERRLVGHRSRVYSQNGEDGAIAELFRRIGTTNKFFIEIGAGDGEENNTRLLLEQGWRGVWAECDAANVARIRAGYGAELSSGQLALLDEPITRENVDALLRPYLIDGAPDLLSIDIDMNTSHVWRALDFVPRAAVIEYNAAMPPSSEWEVPYDPAGVWDGTNYYGASLKCLERIGYEHNMALVGCELTGVNAFFVHYPLAWTTFANPFTAENHFEPSRNLPPIGFPPRARARVAALQQAA